MFILLFTRPIRRIYDLVVPQPRVEEVTEQLEQTSLDDQVSEPSSGMHQKPSKDQTNASGDNSRTAKPADGRHEEHPRAVSGTAARRHPTEHRTSGGDRSRLQAQESLENDYHQLADKHRLLERSNRKLLEEHQTAITTLRGTHATCKEQQEEIKTLREKLRGTSASLDICNQELKVAKTFLSKEDSFSTSDVVQSVRDLNSEIMQTAAHLAENLSLKRICTPPAESIPEGPWKPIFATLVLPQRSGDEVGVEYLELALQGFLAVYSSCIANAWGFDRTTRWCDELYSKLCETENHTVASNWRVLTRRTLNNVYSKQEDLPRQMVDDMIDQLAGLLSSCGIGQFSYNAHSIRGCAVDKLGSLSTAARKLNKMIGENVVSHDLMVTAIDGGDLFNAEYMEDAYARSRAKPAQHTVICTTDLGLCEKRGVRGVKIFLKPKVLTL